MEFKSRLIDDAARLAGGTISVLSNVRAQARQEVRAYIDDLATRLNYVPREDFERLEAQVKQQRLDQIALEKRLAALEPKKAAKTKAAKPKTKPKSRTKPKTKPKKK